jgi:DNA modification methylase
VKPQTIYCGDNLTMLKDVPDESVDLIYIDPPFNSNRNYEVFWGDTQEKRAFNDRFGDAKAYIDYMRPRAMELFRVLKKTGSFYYHCDWHASHYVKVMLDEIFGANNFQNEIAWKRSDAHSDSKQGSKHYGRIFDSIFFYTKSNNYTFNTLYNPLPKSTVENWYKNIEPGTGRKFNKGDLQAPGGAAKGNPYYKWNGHLKYWRYSKENMQKLHDEGKIVYSKSGMPYQKRYLDESKGVSLQNWWDDISMLRGLSAKKNEKIKVERVGYPTQKPIALLERIIEVSSNAGDIVLDSFCGCGTTLIASQKLKRNWVGIDISPTACRVMSQRLWDIFKLNEGKDFYVEDLQKSESDLRIMPHFEFQNWACIALGGIPNRRKTGDFGIDGKLYPIEIEKKKNSGKGLFGDLDIYYPIQVKQVDKAGRPDIDNFQTAIRRDKRTKGYFVAFDFSTDAIKEIKRLDREGEIEVIPITVKQLLHMEGYAPTERQIQAS